MIYTVHNFIFQRKTTGQRDCLTRLLSCILLSCLQQKPQNKGSVIGSVYRNKYIKQIWLTCFNSVRFHLSHPYFVYPTKLKQPALFCFFLSDIATRRNLDYVGHIFTDEWFPNRHHAQITLLNSPGRSSNFGLCNAANRVNELCSHVCVIFIRIYIWHIFLKQEVPQ